MLSLSWPMIVTTSLMMMGPTIDMIWVGRLGAASIAGVGVAGVAVMLVNSMMFGLIGGLRAMVSRFIGGRDQQGAVHVTQQALVVSAIFAIVMAIIGVFLAEPIMRITGVQDDVVARGAEYLKISFVGMVAMSFRMMTDSAMQASGDAMTPMKITLAYRILHVALAPFLIFGWWIFPRLEVSGAALTQVISQAIGTVIGLWFLFTGRTKLRLTFRNFSLDPVMTWRLLKIGIPGSVMGIQANLSQFVLLWFIVPFGTAAVAAHTLNQRIEMFLFMPSMGLGMAAGVLAGQNLGAGQAGRAEKTGWLAAGMVEGIMLIASAAILLWAEKVVYLFSSDPQVVSLASAFLRIAVAGYAVMGIMFIFQQCVAGVGDTVPTMIFSLLIAWGVQIPLAFFLPRMTDLGVYGIRWGMAAGMIAGAVIFAVYFKLGRWKRKQV